MFSDDLDENAGTIKVSKARAATCVGTMEGSWEEKQGGGREGRRVALVHRANFHPMIELESSFFREAGHRGRRERIEPAMAEFAADRIDIPDLYKCGNLLTPGLAEVSA